MSRANPGGFSNVLIRFGILLFALILPNVVAAQTPPPRTAATPVSLVTHPGSGRVPATPPPAWGEGSPRVVAWTQFGSDGVLTARVIAPAACPFISIDGTDDTMVVRAPRGGDRFPDVVCEHVIPATAKSVSIQGHSLPTVPSRISRIAVVGDTGCRIEGKFIQACNDPAAFPLADISAEIAEWKPDLIIHVGDYLYRESPCPPGNTGCAGSPWGDNAATWDADLFGPAASSLATAPWIHVRGNHETCDRAGAGWFRYLDSRPVPNVCEEFTHPFAIDIGGFRFVVMDTASAGDITTTAPLNDAYREQLQEVEKLAGPGAWLLTHKPIGGAVLYLDGKERFVETATIQQAVDNKLPVNISVVISGHIHLAEALIYDPDTGKPYQIVAGNGSTALDASVTGGYDGRVLGVEDLRLIHVAHEFGFFELTLSQDRLLANAVNLDGQSIFSLQLPIPD